MPRKVATLDVSAILADLVTVGSARPAKDKEDRDKRNRDKPNTDKRNSDKGHREDDGLGEALLDAAAELLARYGVRRWSMDDVAEVAGVGRATVYRRFASREELVHATVAREANRFFAEVARAVAATNGLVEKVVEGFLVGMRIANESLIPGLLENDRSTAISLFTSAPVLELGRAALVSQYETLTSNKLGPEGREEVELVAEVLVRLAMSFVLMPGSTVDLGNPGKAKAGLTRIVRPLLLPPENEPRPRPPRRPARR